MNEMISQIKHLYSHISIGRKTDSEICILAHKDRVGFFVWKSLGINKYILFKYWNIDNDIVFALKELFSESIGTISIRVVKIESRFIFIETDWKLALDDFLMYPPEYSMTEDYLSGPYLDNIISSYIIQNIVPKEIEIYQSIDEEALLRYSCFPKKWITIILDTIWQDYIPEPIDMTKIYNVCSTRHKKLISINNPDVIWINLDMPFWLECDFIEWENIIYLLCPITDWHSPSSNIKIETLQKFQKLLFTMIKLYASK